MVTSAQAKVIKQGVNSSVIMMGTFSEKACIQNSLRLVLSKISIITKETLSTGVFLLKKFVKLVRLVVEVVKLSLPKLGAAFNVICSKLRCELAP